MEETFVFMTIITFIIISGITSNSKESDGGNADAAINAFRAIC